MHFAYASRTQKYNGQRSPDVTHTLIIHFVGEEGVQDTEDTS